MDPLTIMTQKALRYLSLATCLLALGTASRAQVLFSDNFNANATGLGISSLVNWNVTRDTVDVLGPGLFDLYPGNGNYLDMAGSGSLAYGRISSAASVSLTPGSYTLSFLLGKNSTGLRTMNVSVGSAFSTTITDSLTYPSFVLQSFTFSVGASTSANIVFDYPNNGTNSNSQGYMIDAVVLEVATAAAPEPTALALLALGGGFFLRRRK
jgi:hypothetical protein